MYFHQFHVVLATYITQFKDNLCSVLQDTNDRTSKPYLYWEISRVVEENVNTIPLRSTNRRDTDDDPHTRGLRNYRPWFVSHHNSASNFGTANLVTKIVEYALDRLQKGYIFIKCDGDIWMKILRVGFTFYFYNIVKLISLDHV